MQQKRHAGYSITSVLLLILGIIFGGLLISLQKATEVLIPFESSGSGQILSLPVASLPDRVETSLSQGSLFASNVVGEGQHVDAFNKQIEILESLSSYDLSGQPVEYATLNWTGTALCQGVPLAGVLTMNGTTKEDGAFSIPVKESTLLYHPTYGYVEVRNRYDTLGTTVDFCRQPEPQVVMEHQYLTTDRKDEVLLSLRAVQRGLMTQRVDTVYLQCWKSDGTEWISFIDGVKTITKENKGIFSLLSVTKEDRAFACQVAPIYNGQTMESTWLSTPGVGEVQYLE